MPQILYQFKGLGVVQVHRCSVIMDGYLIPTQSYSVTFTGIFFPFEVKGDD